MCWCHLFIFYSLIQYSYSFLSSIHISIHISNSQAETTNHVKFKLPSKASRLFKATRFGQWIGRVQAKFGAKITSLKAKFNAYFGNIGRIAARFTRVLTSALTVAGAGTNNRTFKFDNEFEIEYEYQFSKWLLLLYCWYWISVNFVFLFLSIHDQLHT